MANISASAAGAISSPNAISAKALDPESPPFPLNHARILYENVLVGSSIAGDSTSRSLTLIPNTAQRWEFTSGVDTAIQFTLPINKLVDTICIGAHNLGSTGASYQIFYDLDTSEGGFVTACQVTAAVGDDPIMCHLPSIFSVGRVRVNITGGSGGEAYIGSIYAGVALQMMRPFYSGHSPANLSRKTEFYSSNTESGNFIGVEIRRMALETNADWKYLTDAWYRQYFVPFLKSAETQPFYFAWNLRDHPTDVAYCKNIVNISPSYMGQLTYMSVGIPIVGIA